MALTRDDFDNYGTDLVNFSQRAAVDALAPTLQQVQQQQEALRQRLAIEARRNLDQRVEAAVPNYREIDHDPRWHRFLLTNDPLSGCPRQQLLNDAIARGDANRVIAFFRSFLQAERAADKVSTSTQHRASASPDKPVYTRASIAALYERHRKGELDGPAWSRIEQDIFNAQREGRINALPYLTK